MQAAVPLAFLLAAACGRDAPPADTPAGQPREAATSPAGEGTNAPVSLEDVVERDPGYIIGITYPSVANAHPGLARALKAYADAARAELMAAVEARPADAVGPYDLSLSFTELEATPRIVAVAVDGSSYLGGAHGKALVERFVWLPERNAMLVASELFAGADAWAAVSEQTRERLHTRLAQEADDAGLEGEARAEFLRTRARMLEDGTTPEPGNFDILEPVLDGEGRITALRFVFPPYQVAPYAAGTQIVEVPAATLLPHVAADYRALFAGG
ncbi:DUF3298 and DUF4163 domain-containing protein [Luteimonas pelagia]